ncbi:MAG: Ig-like domain-containing protein [Lutibacter sp.]|uniref:Ig-like domain-containing protein n=1 Tax=Lutibacter sp. TaxID=1925666 RepID=UPI00299F3DDC|nr:Ig-like domain-containing protein [Lutibacter sp.]MDX1829557.1 Ig-like domain-containing protein [Lutibacter sp.]
MKLKVYFIILITLFGLTLTNCAKRGRPTGGKKDSIPPLLVHAVPANKSINFIAKKIKISFDEYIKLKDVNKQLVISPPLKNTPIITPVGTASKFISLKILDTLQPNTTYTFNFGNSVVDNNEENKLERFKYVVSTGSYIDSLTVSGKVYDAFNQKTDEDITVELYEITKTFNDSIVYKQKPIYVTSTIDTTANFEIENIKAGKYLLVALKQPSKNYIYHPKQDKFGFYKKIISVPTDTTYEFPIFKEILPFKMIKPKEVSKGHIIFGFEGNPKKLKIELLSSKPDNFKKAEYFENGKDTVNYWFSKLKADSLLFKVTNKKYIDTFTVRLRTAKKDSLQISKITKSVLDLRDTFAIKSNIPITTIDTSKIKLLVDSLNVKYTSTLDKSKTKLYLNFEKKFDKRYTVNFLPNAIKDIFENTNDTLKYKFTTKNIDSYGNINLSVSNVNSPVIIQLQTDKNIVVATKYISKNKNLKFKNLPPKTYIIKAIFDDNNNGIWDTGNFLDKKYPEKVQYFNKKLKLRANFDLNEVFILK